MAERPGLRVFFRGVGPRALSNGLNSAIFYCWFEILRAHLAENLARKQREQQLGLGQRQQAGRLGMSDKVRGGAGCEGECCGRRVARGRMRCGRARGVVGQTKASARCVRRP